MKATPIKTGCFPKLFEGQLPRIQNLVSSNDLDRRKLALSNFIKTGIPTTRNEAWKYTSLRPLTELDLSIADKIPTLLDQQIAEFVLGNATTVVFVDGVLATEIPRLSGLEKGLSLKSISEHKSIGDDGKTNSFSSLNAAFATNGISITVAKETNIETPIQIIHVTASNNHAGFVRNRVRVGLGSKINLIESFVTLDSEILGGFQNSHLDMEIAESAVCKHVRIQTLGDSQTDVSSIDAKLGKSATYKTFTFSSKGNITRNNLAISLQGGGAHTELLGLAVTKQKQHVDNFTYVDHQAANATSRQVYAYVLNDSSRCVFTGKVDVQRDAQQTAAFQLNKNLLLSEDAEVDTRPQLKIGADDVKCCHGATIGQLSSNEVFYLQTRGIKKPDAEFMLAHAFANEVLMDCPIAIAKDRIQIHLNEYFQ